MSKKPPVRAVKDFPNIADVVFSDGNRERYRASPTAGYVYLEAIGGLHQVCDGLGCIGPSPWRSGRGPLADRIRRELRA